MTTWCKSPGIMCDVRTPHVHPKIAKTLLADLEYFRSRGDARLTLRTVQERIVKLAAKTWRDNGRYFLSTRRDVLSVDEDTDRIINSAMPRLLPKNVQIPIIENIVAFKVVDLCRNGRELEDALRHLESLSSRLL